MDYKYINKRVKIRTIRKEGKNIVELKSKLTHEGVPVKSSKDDVKTQEEIAGKIIEGFPVEVENTIFHIRLKTAEIVPGNDEPGDGIEFLIEQMNCLGRLINPQFNIENVNIARAMLGELRRLSERNGDKHFVLANRIYRLDPNVAMEIVRDPGDEISIQSAVDLVLDRHQIMASYDPRRLYDMLAEVVRSE